MFPQYYQGGNPLSVRFAPFQIRRQLLQQASLLIPTDWPSLPLGSLYHLE